MRMPLTLRLIYHGFRAGLRAGLLFVIAWIVFIPANASEATALGATQNTQYPPGLRTMRLAQVVVTLAPPQFYVLAADIAGSDVPPFMLEIAMRQLAAGNVLPPGATVNPGIESDRDIEGPRFIQVD